MQSANPSESTVWLVEDFKILGKAHVVREMKRPGLEDVWSKGGRKTAVHLGI